MPTDPRHATWGTDPSGYCGCDDCNAPDDPAPSVRGAQVPEAARPCVFCEKARAEQWRRTIVSFEPLNPVTPGHMLFVPREHVSDAAENHVLTGLTFQEAARYAEGRGESFNLITSAGAAATQTVHHLHVHYVPRRFDDGLTLPWSAVPVLLSEQQQRIEELERTLRSFADHGLSCDLTPTINCATAATTYEHFRSYLVRLDQNVRDAARAVLGSSEQGDKK